MNKFRLEREFSHQIDATRTRPAMLAPSAAERVGIPRSVRVAVRSPPIGLRARPQRRVEPTKQAVFAFRDGN